MTPTRFERKPRFLTKSRYKLAAECPTKLFYTGKEEYPDQKMDDPFMAALAEGGFQVGALAKHYFPGGHDITTLDHREAEAQTMELLKRDQVVIYEAAIRFQNLFIRIDILEKKGSFLNLVEVKAKSFDATQESPFAKTDVTIRSSWRSYLLDVAFQKHVLSSAFPEFSVLSYLMLADKNAVCTVDGLNQKFRIVRDQNHRKGVKVSGKLSAEDLENPILIKVPVDLEVDDLLHGPALQAEFKGSLIDEIDFFATQYVQDARIWSPIGKRCKRCEFKASAKEETAGCKSGFKECWSHALGWKDKDFEDPTVLEIWNFRRKDQLIEEHKTKIQHLAEEDIDPHPDERPGLSGSQRQWLQVEKVLQGDDSIYFDEDGLRTEMDSWVYPLHFIDFETSMVAIPFNAGRRPYEAIAFQFSHHTVQEDGTIAHAGQFLSTELGVFPNYEFVRELERQLGQDDGSIFMYAPHENSILNSIYRQLMAENTEIPDRDRLCAFIKSITRSTGDSVEQWEGERAMVDLCRLVKRYYYDPTTCGSNSIKDVLPAVLNAGETLQTKYAQPVYGAPGGIISLNFENWIWIEKKDGKVSDPYHKLPRLFADVAQKNLNLLSDDDKLRTGGAALTAYARLQFSEMADYERQELTQALLKYCELDTLAMVMIWEYFNEVLC